MLTKEERLELERKQYRVREDAKKLGPDAYLAWKRERWVSRYGDCNATTMRSALRRSMSFHPSEIELAADLLFALAMSSDASRFIRSKTFARLHKKFVRAKLTNARLREVPVAEAAQ